MKKKPTEKKITAALVQTLEGRIEQSNLMLKSYAEKISALKQEITELNDSADSVAAADDSAIDSLGSQLTEARAETADKCREIVALKSQLSYAHNSELEEKLRAAFVALEQFKAEVEELRKSNRELSANNLSLIARISQAQCPPTGPNKMLQARELLLALGFMDMDSTKEWMKAPDGIWCGVFVSGQQDGAAITKQIYDAGIKIGTQNTIGKAIGLLEEMANL